MVKRNECLRPHNTGYHLYLMIEQLHKMLIVAGKQLDEDSVRTCGEMALHYLGYLLKLGNNLTVKRTPFKIDTYIGACR